MRTININGETFVHCQEIVNERGKIEIIVEVENYDDFCYLYPTREDTTLKDLFKKFNDDNTNN